MEGPRVTRASMHCMVAGVAVCLLAGVTHANLITNPSFEAVPCTTPCNLNQGLMPSGWFTQPIGADTFSNDGSYGLPPGAGGHFPGVSAQDGVRWVSGSSFVNPYFTGEIIGQTFVSPLTAGAAYTLNGYVHRDTGTTGFAAPAPGSWQIELWDSTNPDTAAKIVVGRFGIVSGNDWQQETLEFIAPASASAFSTLVFRPISLSGPPTAAYPGLDNLSLTLSAVAVSEPPGMLLFTGALLALALGSFRRQELLKII